MAVRRLQWAARPFVGRVGPAGPMHLASISCPVAIHSRQAWPCSFQGPLPPSVFMKMASVRSSSVATGWACATCAKRHEALMELAGRSSHGSLTEVSEALDSLTHFDIMGLPTNFDVSAADVEDAYKVLQRQLHPDKHVNAGAESLGLAEAHSARVNEAVAVLRSPLRRAAYWMELKGVKVLEEEQRMEDMETMMEVMEASEEIDSARTQQQVDGLAEKNAAKVVSVETELSLAVAAEDWTKARGIIERLQMLTRLGERMRDWRPPS